MPIPRELAAELLREITGGGLSSRTLAWLSDHRGVTQGPGYTSHVKTRTPMDKYGAPIVPRDWPVNPPGRLA